LSRIPLNAPNVLTLLRLALVPVVAVLVYFDYMIPALAVYLLACGTDLLDGYLARKYKLITDAGILLDPLADKLMAIFTVMAFTFPGVRAEHVASPEMAVLPLYILIVMLVKEGLMIGGGILLYSRGVVAPANKFGKVAAFTLNTSIAFNFLYKYVYPWNIYFLTLGLALMIAALFQYAYFNAYLQLKGKKGSVAKD
jgi:cardiolipin synthase